MKSQLLIICINKVLEVRGVIRLINPVVEFVVNSQSLIIIITRWSCTYLYYFSTLCSMDQANEIP